MLKGSRDHLMRRYQTVRTLVIQLLNTALLLLLSSPLQAQTAREIIDRVDRLLRGESSRGQITMEITTEHWSRSLDMEVWSLGVEHSLVRVQSPAREEGTATLKLSLIHI